MRQARDTTTHHHDHDRSAVIDDNDQPNIEHKLVDDVKPEHVDQQQHYVDHLYLDYSHLLNDRSGGDDKARAVYEQASALEPWEDGEPYDLVDGPTLDDLAALEGDDAG